MGGPGAWQLADRPGERTTLGVDHLVTGYAEGNVAEVFHALLAGESLPPVIEGRGVPAEEIPPVLGPTTMGVVEISRGCGMGCDFCTIAREPMIHLPASTILADARTNMASGKAGIAALSEDVFRYGSERGQVRPDALLTLLEQLRGLPGIGLIQTDHANIMSVAQYSNGQLSRVRELLVGASGSELPWVNLGVETASGELLAASGGAAKMVGAPIERWGEVCARQVRRLIAAGWLPMVSLVVGLPGETREHVRQTLEWVRDMRRERVTIFPVIHAPVDGGPAPARSDLTRLHWRLIRECYELNFRWIPRMYADNQRAVGVPAARRALMQAMGKAQVLQWRTLLALREVTARP